MDKIMFNKFLNGKWRLILYEINAYLIYDLFGVCSGGIYHMKLKNLV